MMDQQQYDNAVALGIIRLVPPAQVGAACAMDEDPTAEAKYVFVRFEDGELTVDYADACSAWEAWAFLLEATDMVRTQIDGNPEDDEDE